MQSDRQIEIHLLHYDKTYGVIHFPKELRRFFPGYKVPFVLETEAGDTKHG